MPPTEKRRSKLGKMTDFACQECLGGMGDRSLGMKTLVGRLAVKESVYWRTASYPDETLQLGVNTIDFSHVQGWCRYFPLDKQSGVASAASIIAWDREPASARCGRGSPEN